jgi:hypothetical protein
MCLTSQVLSQHSPVGTAEKLLRITGLLAAIRTRDLLNMNQELLTTQTRRSATAYIYIYTCIYKVLLSICYRSVQNLSSSRMLSKTQMSKYTEL